MFNTMFLNRQPKESPDELANRLQREGKIGELEKGLQRYSVSKLSEKQKESYYHLLGIAAFQRGDRMMAFRRLQEGLEACPDSQTLLFSLGQEYERRREIGKMFDCFDRCSFPGTFASYMLAAARYAYLWDRPDKGFAYLDTVAEAYFELGVADDHFVYVRGLPFFDQTWNSLVAFALLNNDFQETDEYLSRAIRQLSDYDFQFTQQFYACVKNDDYAPAIRHLETRLQNWHAKLPAGYLRVQLAALKARCDVNIGNALATLEYVSLEANDFPWLDDVLTICRAWAHNRAKNTTSETAEVNRFLARQRLLFEPDHAVAFAFLPYQETMKPKYQNSSLA